MKRSLPILSFMIAASLMGATSSAEAFWVARGWRGGVAVGGVRPPVVARDFYYPRCWRCAPVYPAGALAGAALAGAAVGAAAASAAAPMPARARHGTRAGRTGRAPASQASQASQAEHRPWRRRPLPTRRRRNARGACRRIPR